MCPFPKPGELEDIAYEFEIVPDESQQTQGWTMEVLTTGAEMAMELASQKDGTIDFDDMIFVPVRNGWLRGKYDLVVIDECQDMNAAQIMLAIGVCKMGGRIFVVGDDRQAIYKFRGADSGSLDRLKLQLNAKELGLTITYRCPTMIVDIAKTLVPDYQAAPSAPKGEVTSVGFERIHELALPGDFVLSRKNAPLAKVCLRLLRHGKRAMIEGKDLGRALVTVIKNIRARSIPDFMEKLTIWEDRTCKRLMATKKKSAQDRCEVIKDQAETLRALAEGMKGMQELTDRVFQLFTETPNGKADYIVCSSVHKSKGRERDNVYALKDTLYPGGRRDLEEQNIEYVMVTRAKKKLVWVEGIS
jgi:superfamily I DNA/RNA helicase